MQRYKYYGFRADQKVFDPLLAQLKKKLKRRSVSDLIYFLIADAAERSMIILEVEKTKQDKK